MEGDTRAVVDLGFVGAKLDSCGPSQDLAQWSALFNATGTPVLGKTSSSSSSFVLVLCRPGADIFFATFLLTLPLACTSMYSLTPAPIHTLNNLCASGLHVSLSHSARSCFRVTSSTQHSSVENCFDNASFPFTESGFDNGDEVIEESACPMHMFRSGGDMRADWALMLRRLQTVAPWLRLSRPRC